MESIFFITEYISISFEWEMVVDLKPNETWVVVVVVVLISLK